MDMTMDTQTASSEKLESPFSPPNKSVLASGKKTFVRLMGKDESWLDFPSINATRVVLSDIVDQDKRDTGEPVCSHFLSVAHGLFNTRRLHRLPQLQSLSPEERGKLLAYIGFLHDVVEDYADKLAVRYNLEHLLIKNRKGQWKIASPEAAATMMDAFTKETARVSEEARVIAVSVVVRMTDPAHKEGAERLADQPALANADPYGIAPDLRWNDKTSTYYKDLLFVVKEGTKQVLAKRPDMLEKLALRKQHVYDLNIPLAQKLAFSCLSYQLNYYLNPSTPKAFGAETRKALTAWGFKHVTGLPIPSRAPLKPIICLDKKPKALRPFFSQAVHSFRTFLF